MPIFSQASAMFLPCPRSRIAWVLALHRTGLKTNLPARSNGSTNTLTYQPPISHGLLCGVMISCAALDDLAAIEI